MVVAALLWFSSPLPVKALTITFPTLPSTGTLGQTYSFTVQVTVQDQDLLPIDHINMEMRNVANPTTYVATCNNLPLNNGDKQDTYTRYGGVVQLPLPQRKLGHGLGLWVWLPHGLRLPRPRRYRLSLFRLWLWLRICHRAGHRIHNLQCKLDTAKRLASRATIMSRSLFMAMAPRSSPEPAPSSHSHLQAVAVVAAAEVAVRPRQQGATASLSTPMMKVSLTCRPLSNLRMAKSSSPSIRAPEPEHAVTRD